MLKESQKAFEELELPTKIMEEFEEVVKNKRLNKPQKEKLLKKIKKIYLKSKFEPGELFGIIAAQSISEPATQMCLDYEERIIVKSGNKIDIIKIGDFVESFFVKSGYEKINGYDVCELQEDKFVLSLNQKEKLEWRKVIACNRHKSPEKLIKIRTKSGRQITATDFHSFVTRQHNRIVPISGKDLKIGNRIPVIKHLPENCMQFLDLQNIFNENGKNIVNNNGNISTINSRPLPAVIKLDELFGWFIGAYLADGSYTKYHIGISNIDENFLSKARKFSNRFGFTFNEYDNFRGFSIGRDIHINSVLLSYLLKKLCNKGSDLKKVPDVAFGSDEKFVAGLLRGYFDGDGSISVDRKMIRVSSNSEELIDGIKLLLTRFGIFASKSKDGKQFCLTVPYKYASIFLQKIGSDIKKNRDKLKKLVEMSEKFWKNKSQDFIDVISGFDNILYRIAKKLKYPIRYINNFTKRQKIGRTTLYRYIKLFEKIAKERNINIKSELKTLKKMFNSDVVWDEIEEIRFIKPSSNYVYDLSVKSSKTFTTFDGVITHNTMRTYHFAGSAGIKVTYGLPRLIEIFDARRVPHSPLMTIFLDKGYNTRNQAKKIAESLVEKTIGNEAKKVVINLNENSIEIELSDSKKLNRIVKILKEKLKKTSVRKRVKKIVITPKFEIDIKNLQKAKDKIMSIRVDGIKGITNAVVRREGNDWVINTIGSNLEDVLKVDGVDMRRTVTNDIHEVAKTFGIEAARNLIIEEALDTMQQQGLDVDVRHVMLVGDVMTVDGSVRPIGRYGVAGAKTSILARAAFEETIKHLVRASIRGEIDNFEGIFENVMVGQVIPSGTGMFDLVAKFKSEEGE